jgi:hypothetical protein
MKRVLLTLAVALLIPGMLNAATMGAYFGFGGSQMAYSPPAPFSFFDVYLYLHNSNYYVTAVEYQLQTPLDPGHALFAYQGVEYPDNMSVDLGDPFVGHSITYWPPLNGYIPGYNLLATLKDCYITGPCGSIIDYPLVIGPHPDSGELRGTFTPDHDFFPISGLTSILCPVEFAAEETSWGAIKSLYE